MDWMLLGIALFCIPGNLLAQQGYNYPAPQRPFAGTPGQQEPTGSQAERPSGTQFPQGPLDGYQSPGQQGFSSTRKPISGTQQNGYPSITSGPSKPQGPQLPIPNGYQNGERPSRPSGLYGTPSIPQPRPGYPGSPSVRPDQPQGGYPSRQPGSPQGAYPSGKPGISQGFPGSGSQGQPERPQGYPGPSTAPGSSQSGYPGQPGIPQGSPAPSAVPGFSRQPMGPQGYPGSSRPGTPQTGYPGSPAQGAFPGPPQGPQGPSPQPGFPGGSQGYPGSSQHPQSAPQGYPGPSVRPGFPALAGQQETSQGFPGARPGPSGFPSTGHPASFPQQQSSGQGANEGQYDEGDYSAIPGEPDRDYPIHSYIPETSFSCDQQQYPGYYADVETRCQVFHICANNKTYDFLCPNGTVFHQEYLVCVWWNQFDCNSAPSLYGINANIYDYSIIGAQQTGGQLGFGLQGQGAGSLQGPSGYPQGGLTGTGGIMTEQGSSGRYPGDNRPQPPGFPGLKPTPTEPQRPGYPSTPSNGEQRPGFPSRPQGTGIPSQQTGGYPSGRPQGPTFPGGEGSQRPGGYQGQGGRPQGTSPGFPSDQGGYPNERPGYATTEGYPSDRPASSFTGTSSVSQQPTREYLPPF